VGPWLGAVIDECANDPELLMLIFGATPTIDADHRRRAPTAHVRRAPRPERQLGGL
jgi:hypothetical protein